MKSAASFIADVLIDPETNRPFVVLPSEKLLLKHAFTTQRQPPAIAGSSIRVRRSPAKRPSGHAAARRKLRPLYLSH